MTIENYELFREAVLAAFQKRKTGFLTTESLLKEIRFQKGIFPKEDKERLEAILRQMQEEDLVVFNQMKLAALTDKGKQAVEKFTPERLAELEKANNDRKDS
jgi:hypothetical protein